MNGTRDVHLSNRGWC